MSVPADLVALFDRAYGANNGDSHAEARRAGLAAVLARHEQMVRQKTIRELHTGKVPLDGIAAAQGITGPQNIEDLHSGIDFTDEKYKACQAAKSPEVDLLADAVDAWHDAGDVMLDDRLRAVITMVRRQVADEIRQHASQLDAEVAPWEAEVAILRWTADKITAGGSDA